MCVCVGACNEEVACFVRPLNNVGGKAVRVACFVLKNSSRCMFRIKVGKDLRKRDSGRLAA